LSDKQTTEYHGCGDHGCLVEKPKGMGTNASCRCHRDEKQARLAIRFMASKIREYEAMEKVCHREIIKIPGPDELLIVSVNSDVSDLESAIIGDKMRTFYGLECKILIVRNDIKISALDKKAIESA